MITDRAEIGYVAGFLDGEGTAGLYKRDRKSMHDGFDLCPVVKFCNNSCKALKWIKKKLSIRGKICPRPHYDGRKQSYELATSQRRKIIEILELLLPFLIIKKEQAILLIKFCKLREKDGALILRNENGSFKKFIHVPYNQEELFIYSRMAILNKRGVEK